LSHSNGKTLAALATVASIGFIAAIEKELWPLDKLGASAVLLMA
jgi:hypothetical protein